MADDEHRSDQQRPSGRQPYRGKPQGPYRGKPKGQPYGGGAQGGRPYRGKPEGGGRPYGAKRGGPPFQGKPDASRPQGDRPSPDRERRDEGRPPAGAARHERRVEYGQRERRGPRPQRGWGQRERDPRPGQSWDRRDRFAPPSARGPAPSEVLTEDEEIVAGRRPVEEAFAARREAKRLLVVPERRAALDQLVLHATTLRIPVVEVEGGTITSVSGFEGHQGVALVVAPRRWATLDDVLARARSRGEPPFLLALDHLEDPQNVGTLLRSAEASGVHGVIFPSKGAAPISPAAIKTSAGAVEHLLLVPISDLAGGLVDLHARGLRIIGADGDARLTVREVDMRGPIVIVTGSEGRGLNARVRKRVDVMARIPMRGNVASLNASVAGSVFLFEAATQREIPESAPSPGAPGSLPGATPSVGPETPSEAADTGAEVARATQARAEPQADGEHVADPDDLLPEAPPAPGEESP